jgi:transposase
MTWTEEQYARIQHLLPIQRGNVKLDHLTFLHAMQCMTQNGCRWRAMPKEFGKWQALYRRFRNWTAIGIFDRIENYLMAQAISIKGIKHLAIDSTYVKVHSNGTGALKKTDPNLSEKVVVVGRPRFIPLLLMKTCR